MKPLIPLAAVLAAAAATCSAGAAPPTCGGPRPVVATLRDRPLLLSGHRTTIARLLRLPVEPGGGATTRARAERTVYAVRVRLVKGRYEGSAFGARLIVADPATGETMTVRLPAPECHRGATAAQGAELDAARRSFDEACAPLEYLPWTKLQGEADVTGVLLFGPTGPELSPLLRFRFLGVSC